MKRIIVLVFLLFLVISCIPSISFSKAKAENLSDNIEEQLGNLDLSKMEDFTNDLNSDNSISFTNIVYQIINGEYNSDYSNVKEYLIGLFLNNVNDYLPILFTIVAISVFCGLFPLKLVSPINGFVQSARR